MAFEPRELHPGRSARDLYGWEIRRHRKMAGDMSMTRLAEVLKFSKAHLSRIECAESLPPEGLSEKLDAAFGTDGVFLRLYPLAKKEQFPNRYRRYMELSNEAVAFESYTDTVHGLLQTPAFAAAALRAGDPFASAEEIAQKVAARLQLQERLRGAAPPQYWFILDESGLRRAAGEPHVMRDQLQSLLDASMMRNVTLQILPFSAGFHSETGGSLTLLTLPNGKVVAYEEGSRSGSLIEESDAVAKRDAYYDLLRAQALSPRDTQAMLSVALKGFEDAAPKAARPVAEE
ncbi:helix-turn-helix domain-containing protein [Kitasatospora azatica]|uniref:helix-turn-helix domain-containing protein n=1 Tax=Kitasatospora azatica TaxID=58347 RepID=UPI000559FDC6|nr:helix-turn-helix transcriptional regulator [Kitasatospora azatica]